MGAIAGKQAKVRYTAVTGTSSTDNAATRSTGAGAGVGTPGGFVQINSTLLRHWDMSTTAPTLYESAVLVAASNYQVNYVQGKFEWPPNTDPGVGTYTIDAVTLATSYLTGAKSWSVDTNTDMLDVTVMSASTVDVQSRSFIPGLSEHSVQLERIVSTGTTGPVFFDRLNLDAPVIVELISTGNTRLEGYGFVDGESWANDIADAAGESVSIQITGPLYYSTT